MTDQVVSPDRGAAPDDGSPPPVVIGVSLKLYLDIAQTVAWSRHVAALARSHPAVQHGAVRLFVLPSLPALDAVCDALAGTPVEVGAQDLHWADRGPFTGAVSGADLRAAGCRLVEVGHAERRRLFGDDDDTVRLKLAAAVRNDLVPVLCVGESREGSAEEARTECVAQLDSALEGLLHPPDGGEIIVAYEPEWAIGAAAPASADHIVSIVAALRDRLREEPWLRSARVIYGGSAQPGLLTQLGDGIDGLFLGRYAHDPADFARIVDEAAALR